MFSLKNKNAFVTGGSSGIGKAVAEAFIANGASVVIADIADATEISKEMGAIYVHVNVSDERSVEKALVEAVDALGAPLDIVVLNAGVGDVGPTFEQTDQALIEKVTKINHWGVLYGLKHAPAHMNDDGSIITTSSMAAFINLPGSGVYSAGKRAVISMTEMSALELGSRGASVSTRSVPDTRPRRLAVAKKDKSCARHLRRWVGLRRSTICQVCTVFLPRMPVVT